MTTFWIVFLVVAVSGYSISTVTMVQWNMCFTLGDTFDLSKRTLIITTLLLGVMLGVKYLL